jgi:hypothetical protein
MVVITSDHGNGMVGGEPFRGIGPRNLEHVAWVPLFVRLPGQTKGRIDDRNAWQTDVLPTIADVVGTKVPWQTAGSSLFEPPRRAPTDKIVLDWKESTVHPKEGMFLHLPARSGYAQVLRYRLPGDDDDTTRMYRVPPYGDLVGQRVDDLDVGSPASFRVHLEAPEQFRNVKKDALAPIYVHAIADPLNDDARQPYWVAIALNGRIAGTGQNLVFYGIDPLGPHALVAPEFLRDGDNDVRLYLVEGSPGAERLRPLTP